MSYYNIPNLMVVTENPRVLGRNITMYDPDRAIECSRPDPRCASVCSDGLIYTGVGPFEHYKPGNKGFDYHRKCEAGRLRKEMDERHAKEKQLLSRIELPNRNILLLCHDKSCSCHLIHKAVAEADCVCEDCGLRLGNWAFLCPDCTDFAKIHPRLMQWVLRVVENNRPTSYEWLDNP